MFKVNSDVVEAEAAASLDPLSHGTLHKFSRRGGVVHLFEFRCQATQIPKVLKCRYIFILMCILIHFLVIVIVFLW